MRKNFEKVIMSLSFQERKKKELDRYIKEMKRLENSSSAALHLEYIDTKATYEHKKNILGIFSISLIISILMGVWRGLFSVIGKAIYHMVKYQLSEIELIELTLFFLIIGTLVITGLLCLFLFQYLKKIRNLYKKILMLEEVRRRKDARMGDNQRGTS